MCGQVITALVMRSQVGRRMIRCDRANTTADPTSHRNSERSRCADAGCGYASPSPRVPPFLDARQRRPMVSLGEGEDRGPEGAPPELAAVPAATDRFDRPEPMTGREPMSGHNGVNIGRSYRHLALLKVPVDDLDLAVPHDGLRCSLCSFTGKNVG